MGEEYDETHPFQFFTDHIDPAIAEATREGRRREFARFAAFAGEDVPDPQDVETFERSKLDRAAATPSHRALLRGARSRCGRAPRLPRGRDRASTRTRRCCGSAAAAVELVMNFSAGRLARLTARELRHGRE